MKPEIVRPVPHRLATGVVRHPFPGFKAPGPSTLAKVLVLSALAVGLSACGSRSDKAHINDKTKFSVAEYGVAASPRVTTSKRIRRGGGRAQVGKPYKIRGKWYYPREQPGYDKVGNASWYGPNFHGRLTANGEIYDQYALSGAHPTFPLPSYARVTNLANGNSVVVRINDRGPYSNNRIIDMSAKAAELLDYKRQGIARVRVQYIGKARLDGRDERYLSASYRPGKGYRKKRPGILNDGQSGVLFAGRRPPAKINSAPQLSFVKAPLPKERPVFPGGIPVVMGALQGKAAESPAFSAKIRDGLTISSYVAGRRITSAHIVAQFVAKGGLGNSLGPDDLRSWKMQDR